jgi:hypothetical protein
MVPHDGHPEKNARKQRGIFHIPQFIENMEGLWLSMVCHDIQTWQWNPMETLHCLMEK